MRALLLLAALLLAAPARAQDQAEAQALVDRATLTVQEIMGVEPGAEDSRDLLRRARAAMVCPQLLRAGFFFGGEGGGCVLLARDAAGSWSSPAFYGLASGSFGLQFGIQDAQVLMLIFTEKGLNAVLDSQFKFGADLSLALATVGAGVEGSTTAAAGADILAIARTRGLFAGLALEGSLLSARSDWNRAYYGQEVGSRQIVVAMQVYNPGSDPLRAALIRYGQGGAAAPAPTPASPPPAEVAPGPGLGAVQSSPLPPIAGPRR
ncbi:lipid-binding SYLF domain-containing protein [Siccirubricoccus sp. KC 17139]|uniref:Lipid-binding SYLF domain-containing protein n=1 Tax=Siccirubricoccus soli TaxID=2899147 RepID=A0ABT1D1V5_9PROT|nr:lipid-binding SYLF domain-containing protein [Siccirubricoccus soli]MCO6415899.1 lipid-binding SYLF domain-containing protein [Siccirubricoccus soli]MCP2682031.1 lipid-binding SYLF domain-containing protein [Siccirubricoccus soli]